MSHKLRKILFKTTFFIFSLSTAWWIVEAGFVHKVIDTLLPFRFVAEFVAGMLYTSFLTSPIALAMLIGLAQDNNPIMIAVVGGLGGAFVDFLIVRVLRDNSKDINAVSKELQFQKVAKFLKSYHLEFIIPILGALIIASPFPDEIGLLMLGASKLKYRELLVLTFVLDTAGILLIVVPINLLT